MSLTDNERKFRTNERKKLLFIKGGSKMENKHSSDGIAEDLIRSFVQMASVELHTKTLIQKGYQKLKMAW